MATQSSPGSRPAHRPTIYRWLAGAVAASLALVSVRHSAFLSAGFTAPGPHPVPGGAAKVLRHADPVRPFEDRWEWARAEARRRGSGGVWIGYSVRRSLMVDIRGLALPGPRLTEIVGPAEGLDDLALLFRFAPATGPAAGTIELARVHALGFLAPVDLDGEALLWLGVADDEASLARLQVLFAEARTAALREDLVAAVGLHGSTTAVVPLLGRWATSDEPYNVRAEAARWLRHHRPQPTRRRSPGASARNVLDSRGGLGVLDTTNTFVLWS